MFLGREDHEKSLFWGTSSTISIEGGEGGKLKLLMLFDLEELLSFEIFVEVKEYSELELLKTGREGVNAVVTAGMSEITRLHGEFGVGTDE